MADRCHLANGKTALIYFNYTVTCYTILTIKQQILILTRSSAVAEGPRDASCQLKSCCGDDDDDDDDDDDGRINFNVAYSPKTARTRNS